MFHSSPLVQSNEVPAEDDFFNTRFNLLMNYQNERVKRSYQSALESKRLKDDRVMQALSTEILKQKHDEFVNEKERQRLKEESVELRQLRADLRVAQSSMELVNRKAADALTNRSHAEIARAVGRQRAEAECQRTLEYTQEVRNAFRQKQQDLRLTLLSQMAEHQAERNQQQQQVLLDRDQRYEMQRQMEIEEAENMQQKLQKMQKTRGEMYESMNQLAELKSLMRRQAKEGQAGKEYTECIERLHAARIKAKLDKWNEIAQHQEKSARIGAHIYAIENGKRQREQLLLDLLQKEHQNRMDLDYREQLDKELKQRRQIKQELDRSHMEAHWRNEQIAHDKAIEAEQVREAAKLVDPGLEVERNRKKHDQRKQYGAVLVSMMVENRKKREEHSAEFSKFMELKTKDENDRDKMIFEERVKMLQSVPPETLRYLRNGILTRTDVDNLEGPAKQVASEICRY